MSKIGFIGLDIMGTPMAGHLLKGGYELNIEAVGEAPLFASRMGADAGKLRQALMGGFAASRVLEAHALESIASFDIGGTVAQ